MKKQTGFSLMEIMLILGVCSLLLAGTVALFRTVNGKATADRVVGSTEELLLNLETGVGQMQSYYGLNSQTAAAQGLLPQGFKSSNGARSAWGRVSIAPWGAQYNGIRLTFENVPADQCLEFVRRLAPLMVAIRVNEQLVVENRNADPGQVAEGCAGGGSVSFDRYEQSYGRKAMWETW